MSVATATPTELFLHKHYQEVRKRLWKTKPIIKEVVQIKKIEEIEHEPENIEPQWERIEFGRAKKINRIIDECIQENGITLEQFRGSTKFRNIVEARRLAAYRLRTEIIINGDRMSYPQIARAMGGFDHKTIIHHVKKYCAIHGLENPTVKYGGEK